MQTMDYTYFVEWRKEQGFTQKDLAERLGVNLTSVKRWETGARKLPPYIGLLMAAVEHNLEPVGAHAMYDTDQEPDHDVDGDDASPPTP